MVAEVGQVRVTDRNIDWWLTLAFFATVVVEFSINTSRMSNEIDLPSTLEKQIFLVEGTAESFTGASRNPHDLLEDYATSSPTLGTSYG